MRLRVAKRVLRRRGNNRFFTIEHALGKVRRAHRRGSALLHFPRKDPFATPMYVIDAGRPAPARDFYDGVLFMESAFSRIVRKTYVAGIEISTVFLGLDHNYSRIGPPVLWESMVFADKDMPGAEDINCYQRRYASRREAVEGHQEMVDEVHAFLATRPQG